MSVAAPAPTRTGPAPESPYVGLVPFGEDDAGFFFGRSQEIAIVSANLRSARLTIVYGPSGAGKSSLLQAGVVHGLREAARAGDSDAPFAVCTVRSWHDDPKHRLLQAASDALRELSRDALPAPGGTLAQSLRAWTGDTGTLLVVLDQFEEYFQYHDGEADGERLTGFAAELADVVNDPTVAVHVLISIREDAWAKLDRFEGHIPLLFANYLRVEHLDVDAAREAIEGPIAAWNATLAPAEPYSVEPELTAAVLAAAAAGLALDGDEDAAAQALARGGVEAPFLQLVLERLWRATVADRDHVLTLARLDRLGGARKIVENHLVDALARLTREEQDVASDCFRFLVSRSKTKIAHPPADLAEWTRRPEPVVTAVLDRLTGGESGRILRAVAPPRDRSGSSSYELFHDVLAEPILAWRLAHERDRSRREAQRRLLRVGGAALALVAVFAALAVWALVERGHANGLYREQQEIRRAVEAQNRILRRERNEVAATVQTNKDQGTAENATIDELNATRSRLQGQTSELRKQRNALDGRIATLRAQNRRLSTTIARLNKQNRSLAVKVTTLRRKGAALAARLAALVLAHDSLADNAGTLRTEAAALASELKAARREQEALEQKAVALGYRSAGAAGAPQEGAVARGRIPPEQAKHYGIPAALKVSDALRAEVERLQRELARLLEQRALNADEIGFLRSLNALLVRQRGVLRLEIDHLSRTRASLESLQRKLEQTLSSVQAEHARLSGLVSTAAATHAERTRAVAAQLGVNERLQDRNNERIADIDRTRSELVGTQDDSRHLIDFISPRVKKLTAGAQDTTQDAILAALLATAAYQVTPFDPEDASHPDVYNALWLVLSRLDPNGARDLIAPVVKPTERVGTTTSAVLKTKVCAFVSRGFTLDEWREWLPAGAPYPSELSNPCG
jgi:septal ring factor EnvC (AmiA/AmiB activator)